MELTDDTFLIYASKYYDNPQCSSYEEFEEDLKRIQYIKRLFNRYESSGELKERLILNHIIVLYNCFGLATTGILFLKLKEHSHVLKPFIIKLNYMPDFVVYNKQRIRSSDIRMDQIVIEKLRNI
jgi:hypothetical protein